MSAVTDVEREADSLLWWVRARQKQKYQAVYLPQLWRLVFGGVCHSRCAECAAAFGARTIRITKRYTLTHEKKYTKRQNGCFIETTTL